MKTAGKIKGPGKPDGTGPYGGTEDCQLSEEEKKKKNRLAKELRTIASMLDKKAEIPEILDLPRWWANSLSQLTQLINGPWANYLQEIHDNIIQMEAGEQQTEQYYDALLRNEAYALNDAVNAINTSLKEHKANMEAYVQKLSAQI